MSNTCDNCIYAIYTADDEILRRSDHLIHCRRYPPTPSEPFRAVYVSRSHWCGEHVKLTLNQGKDAYAQDPPQLP